MRLSHSVWCLISQLTSPPQVFGASSTPSLRVRRAQVRPLLQILQLTFLVVLTYAEAIATLIDTHT